MSNPAYAAFQYKDFRFYVGIQFLYTVAILAQEAVLGYHLYKVTGDKLALGIIGLLEAIPYLVLALFGGYIADRFDKRKIAIVCISFMALISLFLTVGMEKIGYENDCRYLVYSSVFMIGFCRGFMGPAWSSMKAFLVQKEHYANAASWSSQFWQSGMVIGPAISGILYAGLGIKNTLIAVVIVFAVCALLLTQIKAKVTSEIKMEHNLLLSLKEGFSFVRNTKILLYAVMLDMFSVLFGGVIAILPVFAEDILKVGPQAYGILRAMPGIGAVITMFITAHYPPTRKAWRNMLLAILGFGIATLVFALSTNIYLSCIAMFFTGAFDSISVVVRQTILQVLPPVEMRGRVSAINGVFVSCSNELGAFESGLAAQMLGTVRSVVFGAGMTIFIIGLVYLRTKELFQYRLDKAIKN